MANTSLAVHRIVDPNSHDPNFYIEEGNVVLSARDSENHTTHFRLLKSTLVKHSPHVFGNMFDIPSPPTIEQYDGAPVVDMPDDADDLRGLFTFFYDAEFALKIFNTSNFTVYLLGPTRLAKKYQVDWIVEMVASELEKRWPTTLRGWDAIVEEEEEEQSRLMHECVSIDRDKTLRLRRFPEPASSIILARECEVPTILPFAFYNLLAWPWVSLDETPEDYEYLVAGKNVPQVDLVPVGDMRRILEAREWIARWFSAHQASAEWNPCGSDMACQKRTARTWLRVAVHLSPTGDFLRSSRCAAAWMNLHSDICPECKEALLDRIERLRGELADQLRSVLQL